MAEEKGIIMEEEVKPMYIAASTSCGELVLKYQPDADVYVEYASVGSIANAKFMATALNALKESSED